MNKVSYQESLDVSNFVDYLNQSLSKFPHSYLNRKSQNIWECDGLIDACNKYGWSFKYSDPTTNYIINGNTFDQNKKALDSLSEGLKKAYEEMDNNLLLKFSIAICQWGGVLGSENYGNKKTLIQNVNDLHSLYRRTGEALMSGDDNQENIKNIFNMNAGFTKIYSLLFDNLIIYDSRVGAALCLLVKKYCELNNLENIPESLLFTWAKSKEGPNTFNPKNRNPGKVKNKSFPNFSIDKNLHTLSMLKSSWLIEKLVKNNKKIPEKTISAKMRSIEAALFMIGYDIPPSVEKKLLNQNKLEYQFCTKGGEKQRKYFNVTYTEKGIIITNNDGRIIEYTFTEINQILDSLEKEFSNNWFPLANNVEKISNNTEQPGLGMTIKKTTKNQIKAQGSSYLGPYLEELGILSYSKKKKTDTSKLIIGWEINVNKLNIDVSQMIEEYQKD